ncbi:MAG: DUF58 domain-containing protein [Planctomycetota bacterium]|nr:DUF58 domain-containing protein [Planctomycetota bacterium]
MDSRYFDPEGLARVGNMELVARQVVEGFITGRHRSPFHGFSAEYLDHRAYTPGDEISTIDWKVLARTDKYFVKLDKLGYGCYLAAALSYLLLRQNDSVGLTLFDTDIKQYIPPQAHPTQFRRILDSLDASASEGDTAVGPVLHRVAERIKRRGLVIIISDLLDKESEIADGLQHFRHNRHEVIVFHVLDDAELTFPYDRLTRFKDMEGAGKVLVNPKSLRKRYLERITAFTENLKNLCFERKISYHLTKTSQPYAACLAEYLDKRSRLG